MQFKDKADQLVGLLQWANETNGHAGKTYAGIRDALSALVLTETGHDISESDILFADPEWLEVAIGQARDRLVYTLSPMFAGYAECALWSSTDDNQNPLDATYNRSDIDIDDYHKMVGDCCDFWRANHVHLQWLVDNLDVSLSQIGHDLWLTRNGHGAGFWDRGYPQDISDALSDAAEKMGECNLYESDPNEYGEKSVCIL